jgi:hypothetical protein
MSLQPIIRTLSQPLFAILLSVPALAQQPAPPIPSTGFPWLDEYRASRISIYTDDFGQLARYRDADAALAAPAAGQSRVVFLGDCYQTIFPASLISTAVLTGRPRPRCWCVSGRM